MDFNSDSMDYKSNPYYADDAYLKDEMNLFSNSNSECETELPKQQLYLQTFEQFVFAEEI